MTTRYTNSLIIDSYLEDALDDASVGGLLGGGNAGNLGAGPGHEDVAGGLGVVLGVEDAHDEVLHLVVLKVIPHLLGATGALTLQDERRIVLVAHKHPSEGCVSIQRSEGRRWRGQGRGVEVI